MKAHDVRHLCVCAACKNLGDDREMIHAIGSYWHGKCAFAEFGLPGIETLPKAEREKFRLDEIGAKAMRRLVELG